MTEKQVYLQAELREQDKEPVTALVRRWRELLAWLQLNVKENKPVPNMRLEVSALELTLDEVLEMNAMGKHEFLITEFEESGVIETDSRYDAAAAKLENDLVVAVPTRAEAFQMMREANFCVVPQIDEETSYPYLEIFDKDFDEQFRWLGKVQADTVEIQIRWFNNWALLYAAAEAVDGRVWPQGFGNVKIYLGGSWFKTFSLDNADMALAFIKGYKMAAHDIAGMAACLGLLAPEYNAKGHIVLSLAPALKVTLGAESEAREFLRAYALTCGKGRLIGLKENHNVDTRP